MMVIDDVTNTATEQGRVRMKNDWRETGRIFCTKMSMLTLWVLSRPRPKGLKL